MAAPKWFRSAIATVYGWAHPITGEQLTSETGLDNPVAVYKPNRPKDAFIDETKPYNIGVEWKGNRVFAHLTSLSPVVGDVTWTLYDPNYLTVVGGVYFTGTNPGFGTTTITCEAVLEDSTVINDYVIFQVGEKSQFPPEFKEPYNTNFFISGTPKVGETATVNYAFEEYDLETTYSVQWYISDTYAATPVLIDGATEETYVIQEADQGKFLKCNVIASNKNDTVSTLVRNFPGGFGPIDPADPVGP